MMLCPKKRGLTFCHMYFFPYKNYYGTMTDFILDDGTAVDHGQMYEIDLITGTFILTIDALFPRKEQMLFKLQESDWAVTRDMMWSDFSMWYNKGSIRRYNTGQPSRRLPPHTFT